MKRRGSTRNDNRSKCTKTNGIDDAPDGSVSFPDEVWAHVSTFLADAPSVCRSALVCRSLHRVTTLRAATEPSHVESLWKTLSDVRWKFAPIRKPDDSSQRFSDQVVHHRDVKGAHVVKWKLIRKPDDSSQRFSEQAVHHRDAKGAYVDNDELTLINQCFSYQMVYQQRHQFDAQVARVVREVSLSLVKDDWSTATVTVNEWLSQVTLDGQFSNCPSNVLDGLIRWYWNSNQDAGPTMVTRRSDAAKQQRFLAAQRGVVCILTDYFFFEHILQLPVWEQYLLPSAIEDYEDTTSTGISMLLTGVACLSHFLWDETTLMTHLNDGLDSAQCAIEAQLCKYGNELKAAIGDSVTTTLSKVTTFLTLMFDSWGFEGTLTNRMSHSSVYSVLVEKEIGNPISLVVIAKLILARVGVPAHVIGVPGSALLGVSDDTEQPTRNYYFEMHQCQRYGTMSPIDFQVDVFPLTVSGILTCVLSTIPISHDDTLLADRTGRLLDALDSLPRISSIPLILDQTVFD